MKFGGGDGRTGFIQAAATPLPTDRVSVSSPHHVEEGYRRCVALTRHRSRTFFYAFAPLAAPQRRGLYALYHFSQACHDIAKGPLPLEGKQLALERQERLLDQVYRDEETVDSVEAAALADTIRRFRIPRVHFDDFLLGIRSDLTPPQHQCFGELRTYCARVASTIGLMAMEIIGYDRRHAAEARAAAVELAIAIQLTALLRDIKDDARRGRIYFPEVERQEYDLTPADFARGIVDERFQGFIAFQIHRARHHFRRGSRLLAYVPRRSRACPATLAALYSRLLDRIESHRCDVFRHRIELNPAQRAGLALMSWGRTWLLPAPRIP